MIANYFPSFITGAEPQIEFYTDTAEHFQVRGMTSALLWKETQMRMKMI